MREPPSLLSHAELLAMARAAYGPRIVELRFLPLGHDSSAWVYRAELAEGPPGFLKLRAGPVNEAGLRVPYLLHAAGLAEAVAPIPTREGALWASAGPWSLILYPFVDAASAMAAGLSERQWEAYGAALRRAHSTPVPAGLAALMRRERYAPPGAELLRQVDAALQGPPPDEPRARELAAFWQGRRGEILRLLARAELLGQELARRELPLVLCHADIHTGNVLREGEDRIWIVDWDEALLAPKERDLMFVIGGISRRLVRPRDEAACLRGYGPAAVDPAALAYYRYAWAVSDIAAYSGDLLFRPDLGAVSRAAALESLIGLFAPGEIVDIAQDEAGR